MADIKLNDSTLDTLGGLALQLVEGTPNLEPETDPDLSEFNDTLRLNRQKTLGEKQVQQSSDMIRDAYYSEEGLGIGSIGNTSEEGYYADTANRRKAYDIMHDMSYLDSTEYAIRSLGERKQYENEYSTILNSNDAHNLSKDLGVELKYDKDVTEGKVRFDVAKELKRQELQAELIKFKEQKDYNTFQNILLMGSAMSGAMPLSELVATGAISMVGGMGTAAALTKFASVANNASKLTRAIKYAQRATMAEKRAMLYANKASILNKATHKAMAARELAKQEGFVGKLAYDTYRFGKGAQGTHASLATTMIPFATDAIVSTIPRTSLLTYSEGDRVDGYGTKEALSELMMAGAFGAALPAIGAVSKRIPSAFSNMKNNVDSNVDAMLTTRQVEAELLGHEGEAESIQMTKEEVKDLTNKVFEIADNQKVTAETEEGARQISASNLTEDDISVLLEYGSRALKGQTSFGLLDKLPFKNSFFTKVRGMLDYVTEHNKQGLSGIDFVKGLENKGVRLYKRGMSDDIRGNITDVTSLVKGATRGSELRISTDTGVLGEIPVKALNQEDAQNLIADIYTARLLDSTEEGVAAGIRVEEYIDRLNKISFKIRDIVNTYDTITQMAKEAKGSKGKYFTIKDQAEAYRLNDGSFGSLTNTVNELAEMLLPQKEQTDLLNYRNIMRDQNLKAEILGRSDMPEEELYKIQKMAESAEEAKQEIVDYLLTHPSIDSAEKTYVNLQVHGEKNKEHTRTLKKLANQIDSMVTNNSELLNSDRRFEETLGDPEEILNRLNQGLDAPEIGIDYTGKSINNLQMQEVVKDEAATLNRLSNTKAELSSLAGSDAETHTLEVIELMNKETENGARLISSNFAHNQQSIVASEEILKSNFKDIRNEVLDAIKNNPDLERAISLNAGKGVGPISEAVINSSIRQEASIFGDIITEKIIEPLLAKFPKGVFEQRMRDSLEETLGNFMKSVKDTNNESLTKLLNTFEANIGDTPEEAVSAIRQADAQRLAMDEFLKPLIKDIGVSVMDFQNELMNSQINTMKCWERCHKAGFRMNEAILGEITQTAMPFEGASNSIENLSDITTEFTAFKKALAMSKEDGSNLFEYAFDESNFKDIQNAILDRYALESGLMSDAEKLAFKENSQAGRVAKIYLDNLAQMQSLLYNVGSGKKNLVSMFDNTKLHKAYENLANKMDGSVIDRSIKHYLDKLPNEGNYSKIKDALTRFLPTREDSYEQGMSNLSRYFFSNLDLDKHFNRKGSLKVSLNELRDAIMNSTTGTGARTLETLINDYGMPRVTHALETITRGILGTDTEYGLIKKLMVGSKDISAEIASQRSKLLNDMDSKLFFKDLTSYKDAIKSFGYDKLKNWYESDMGKAKRSYAILSKASSEPFQFYRDILEMARTYAYKVAPHKGDNSKEYMATVKAFQERISDKSFFQKQVDYCLNKACGNYSSPATGGKLFAKLALRFFGSPMIIKAGPKSLTDNAFQFQDACSMGIMSSSSFKDRANIIKTMFRIFTKDRKISEALLINNALKTNAVSEALLNESSVTSQEGRSLKDIFNIMKGSGLNEYASKETKAEYFVKGWTDFISNKMAWIGPLTEYNRTSAGLNIMSAIGDMGKLTYKEFPDDLFRKTLRRFDVSEYEWDNIFSKHGCSSLHDYLKSINNEAPDMFRDRAMFFPDKILDLTDDQIKEFMQAQHFKNITAESIQRYRQNLVDKASMLVNSSANEMTSIPTHRVQSLLTLGYDENSKAGLTASIASQFQSFGVAALQYHMARRFATHLDDATVPLAKHLLLSSTGLASTAKDLFEMVTELALCQYFLNEGIAYMTGTNQDFVDELGEVDPKILSGKILKAYFDQAGIAGPILDGIMTGITEGRGLGGGIALSIAPVPSSLITSAGKIIRAGVKESNEGNRMKAIAAQTATEVFNNTGIPKHVLTQALWGVTIGDYLNEMSMGDTYEQYMDNRYSRGFRHNWARDLIKDGRLY